MRTVANQLSTAIFSPDEQFRGKMKEVLINTGMAEISAECGGYYSNVDFWFFEDIKRLNPDLAIVDLSPDPESGITTTQKLQELEQPPAVFVIHHQADPNLIIRAMRSGATEFLIKPVQREQLAEALKRVSKQRENIVKTKKHTGRVYTFFSPKGGGGSTTIASNLAVNLVRLTQKSVLLMDLDLQLGEVALFLGIKPRFNILDLVENIHRLDVSLLDGFLVKHPSGVHVLAAPDQLSKAEMVNATQIGEIISFLRELYSFIVIDTSNTLDNVAVTAFDYSDKIFAVSNMDLPSLRNAQRCLHMMNQLGFKKERIKLLVNRYEKGKEITLKDIEKILDCSVYWTFPSDYPTVITSINMGVPLTTFNNTEIARSIDQFAQEVSGAVVKAPEKKKGLFSFLKRSA